MKRQHMAVPAFLSALLSAWAVDSVAGTVEPPFQIGGAYAVRVTSLKEARLATTVRQQHDFSCGSAALATLLTHHYGQPTSERQVFDTMLRSADPEQVRREGFSMLDMKHYLDAAGFEANGFEASLADLASAGIPAIAVIHERGYPHFVVIQGVQDGRVLVADPAVGLRAMPVAAFEALRADTILFVIGNRRSDAGFNLAAHWRVMPRAPLADRPGAVADLGAQWRSGSGH